MSESQSLTPGKPESDSSSSKGGRPSRRKGGKPPRKREALEEVSGLHIRKEGSCYSIIYTKSPLVEVERHKVKVDRADPLWIVLPRIMDKLEKIGNSNDIDFS